MKMKKPIMWAVVVGALIALTGCSGVAIGTGVADGGDASPTVQAVDVGDAAPEAADASSEAAVDAGPEASVDAGPQPGQDCMIGSATCNGPDALKCVGGKWQLQATCGGGTPVCENGLCVVCSENAKSCVGAVPRTCSAGQWVYADQCSGANNVCLDGTCVQCAPGQKQCTGTTPQVCSVNGTWQDQAACAGSTPTCDGPTATCVECAPGDNRCSGLDSQTCAATKKWVKVKTCAIVCGGAGVCGVCTPNSVRCTPDPSDVAQTCNASGQWYTNTSMVTSRQDGASSCYAACAGDPKFKVNDVTNTVYDTTTMLTWERNVKYVSGGYINYADAVAACAAKGQRLPTRSETDALRPAQALTCGYFDESAFPGIEGSRTGFWTSTVIGTPGQHYVAIDTFSQDDTSLRNVMCVK
jgi:hypothetical protein